MLFIFKQLLASELVIATAELAASSPTFL